MKTPDKARAKFGDGDYTVHKTTEKMKISEVGQYVDVDHYATLDSDGNVVIAIPTEYIKGSKRGITNAAKFTKQFDVTAVKTNG